MTDSSAAAPDKKSVPLIAKRVLRGVIGIAQDFWADGAENPFGAVQRSTGEFIKQKVPGLQKLPILGAVISSASAPEAAPVKKSQQAEKAEPPKPQWHAEPGEISEKMWGDGVVAPGDTTIWHAMVKPLGLNKTMSVLHLSGGLGGNVRKMSEETEAYITGFEPDAGVAARGMDMSRHAGKAIHAPIVHYDPAHLKVDRVYDCILSRETFYRVADKPAFFKTLSDNCKPKGQIAFTDYIVDAENREQPTIKAWMEFEKATPLSLIEMAEAWAKVGFSLRVNEDLSAYYAKEVAGGLKRLSVFLASSLPPDPETKKAVLRRIDTWNHRMKAMSQGMKFYRFYGTKQ